MDSLVVFIIFFSLVTVLMVTYYYQTKCFEKHNFFSYLPFNKSLETVNAEEKRLSLMTMNVSFLKELLSSNHELRAINHSAIKSAYSQTHWSIQNTIPKNIHFIWIGSIFPDRYISNLKSFCIKNKDYSIFLWTDYDEKIVMKNLETKNITHVSVKNIYSLPFINKKLILKEPNSAGKCDLLRFEIVYIKGGIYIDMDYEARKAFDRNFQHPFMTATVEGKHMLNSCFGLPKGSSFLFFVIKALQLNYNRKKHIKLRTGNYLLSECFVQSVELNITIIDPHYLTYRPGAYKGAYTAHTSDGLKSRTGWLGRKDTRGYRKL